MAFRRLDLLRVVMLIDLTLSPATQQNHITIQWSSRKRRLNARGRFLELLRARHQNARRITPRRIIGPLTFAIQYLVIARAMPP